MVKFQCACDFCKEWAVFKEKNDGVLGKKLKKLDPSARVSCVYSCFDSRQLVSALHLFPVYDLFQVQQNQEYIKAAFREEDYLTALKWSTINLQAAKINSIEACHAYSCRSAALMRLNRCEECLLDINRALRQQWDADETKIVTDHKTKCVDKLFNDRRAKLNSKIITTADDLDPNYKEYFQLPKIENPHEWIPNASKKIKFQFSSKYGRHLIAAEDISPGEILFVDKPYAYALGIKSQLSNCSHCFVRCLALIPCVNCKTLFCSDSCRTQAFSQYHRIECQIMNNMKANLCDLDSKLALRMLMIATRQGKDLKKLSEHTLYQNPFNPPIRSITKRHFEEEYFYIHHLESHDNELKNYDLAELCHKAAVLLELLRWTTFFENRNAITEPYPLTKEQLFVSSLLLKYLSIIRFNGIMIRDRVERPEEMQRGAYFYDVLQTGLAIYPLCCLLNHSCNSNALIVSFKTSCACYTTQPILKGEQIFINYECHYLTHSLEYRLQRLEDIYYFKCHCRPCIEKWPQMYTKPKLQRTSTRHPDEGMKLLKNKMEQLVAIGNVKAMYDREHVSFLCDLMTKFYRHTTHPNLTYENATTLLTSILISQGNNYELADNAVLCNYCFCAPKLTKDIMI